MILFLLKKNFCDGWDNMISLVVPNVVMTILAVILWVLYGILNAAGNMILGMAFTALIPAVFMMFVFAYGENAVRIANFGTGPIRDFFANIVPHAKDGFLIGLIFGVFVIFASVGIPYYMSIARDGNLLGIFFAACVFWFSFIALLALQWFIPVKLILKDNFKTALKKCFIIFFDNPGISLFLFFYHCVLAVLSFFLLGCAPGATGILLSLTNALRILLYKYDYLDAHPELTGRARRKIPWSDLIAKDKETLGPRTLRSFIFPWRD